MGEVRASAFVLKGKCKALKRCQITSFIHWDGASFVKKSRQELEESFTARFYLMFGELLKV